MYEIVIWHGVLHTLYYVVRKGADDEDWEAVASFRSRLDARCYIADIAWGGAAD